MNLTNIFGPTHWLKCEGLQEYGEEDPNLHIGEEIPWALATAHTKRRECLPFQILWITMRWIKTENLKKKDNTRSLVTTSQHCTMY